MEIRGCVTLRLMLTLYVYCEKLEIKCKAYCFTRWRYEDVGLNVRKNFSISILKVFFESVGPHFDRKNLVFRNVTS